VLSIGKLGQGQENYYLESVAQGIEDYYTGAGEAPGRWTGSAARELGLQGEVDGDGLQAALAGSNPATAAPLAAQRGGARVPGFDLTFRPPKSVSVLFGLADSEISSEVRDAHDAAVDSALDYMERHAAVARRGHGGVESVPGNGFLAAAFRHRTSRAGDPQLHTHVLVANITRGPDEQWTALDGRKVYAHAKTGGYLYQAALRRELVRRLGVEWGPVHNGSAEVAGIPQPVLRAFSRRRAEIERTMAERGEHSQRAAQVAALDTRQAKDYGVSAESLRGRWRAHASRLGLEWEQLAELT
jgi:conjugative relaxase-like TrwC/TraI family protein